MKDTFRKHGKWLFIPSPALIFTGAVLPIPAMMWAGMVLMLLLIGVLITQMVMKLELIN